MQCFSVSGWFHVTYASLRSSVSSQTRGSFIFERMNHIYVHIFTCTYDIYICVYVDSFTYILNTSIHPLKGHFHSFLVCKEHHNNSVTEDSFVSDILISFLLNGFSEEGLLNHVVAVILIFWGTSSCFPYWFSQFTFYHWYIRVLFSAHSSQNVLPFLSFWE